jgi:hypothetical protein
MLGIPGYGGMLAYQDTFDADTCPVRAFAAAACTGTDDSRDVDQWDLVVATDAWAFDPHKSYHNSFPAARCRKAIALVAVAVVVAMAWDIVAVVSVEAFVTTHLRPRTSVAVAVEILRPTWILLLVRLLRSSRDLNQHDGQQISSSRKTYCSVD